VLRRFGGEDGPLISSCWLAKTAWREVGEVDPPASFVQLDDRLLPADLLPFPLLATARSSCPLASLSHLASVIASPHPFPGRLEVCSFPPVLRSKGSVVLVRRRKSTRSEKARRDVADVVETGKRKKRRRYCCCWERRKSRCCWYGQGRSSKNGSTGRKLALSWFDWKSVGDSESWNSGCCSGGEKAEAWTSSEVRDATCGRSGRKRKRRGAVGNAGRVDGDARETLLGVLTRKGSLDYGTGQLMDLAGDLGQEGVRKPARKGTSP
jgi:hypothetical protein